MKKIIILSVMILFFVVEVNAQNKSYQGIRASYAYLWGVGRDFIIIENETMYYEMVLGTYRGNKFVASYKLFYPALISENIGLSLGLGVGYAKHDLGAGGIFIDYKKEDFRGRIIKGEIDMNFYRQFHGTSQEFIFLQGETALEWRLFNEFRISLGADVLCFKKPFATNFYWSVDTAVAINGQSSGEFMGEKQVETIYLDEPFGRFYVLPHLGMNYMLDIGAGNKLVPELKVQFMRETWDSGTLKGMTKFRQLNTVFGLSLLF